jgi:hypothetical protein
MRYVHPTPEHKRQAVQKLETFNAEQVFAVYEARQGSPQKSHSNMRGMLERGCKLLKTLVGPPGLEPGTNGL